MGGNERMNLTNGNRPFFNFTLANVLTILLLLAMAASWWINHEAAATRVQSSNDVANNTQTMLLAEHEKRFSALQDQINELNKTQKEMLPALQELSVKFRVMVELVDGNRTKPELHK